MEKKSDINGQSRTYSDFKWLIIKIYLQETASAATGFKGLKTCLLPVLCILLTCTYKMQNNSQFSSQFGICTQSDSYYRKKTLVSAILLVSIVSAKLALATVS